MMAHQVAGKASRDGIFLSQFGISALPAMVTAAAIAAIVTSIVGSRILVRLGPHRLAPLSFALSGMVQIAEWFLLGYSARIGACVIYLHVVAFGALLLSCFWSLMNESFEPRSAKAAFAKISGAGTLGGLCGGLFAERVAAWFGTSDVMLLLAALHLACASLLLGVAKVRGFRSQDSSHEPRPIDAVQRYPPARWPARNHDICGNRPSRFRIQGRRAQAIGRGAPLLRFALLHGNEPADFLKFLARFSYSRASRVPLASGFDFGEPTACWFQVSVLAVVRASEIGLRGSLWSGYELFTPRSARRQAGG
jgi:hypothetical protein